MSNDCRWKEKKEKNKKKTKIIQEDTGERSEGYSEKDNEGKEEFLAIIDCPACAFHNLVVACVQSRTKGQVEAESITKKPFDLD